MIFDSTFQESVLLGDQMTHEPGLPMKNTCLSDYIHLFHHDCITQLGKCTSDTLYGCSLYSLRQKITPSIKIVAMTM